MTHQKPGLEHGAGAIKVAFAAILAAALLVGSPAAIVFAAQGDCSQPLSEGSGPTARDCLYILQVAVGSRSCEPACLCSPTGTRKSAASDALLCLQVAVGGDRDLECGCGEIFGALGDPLPTATPEQLETFVRGRDVAEKRFDAPGGLGPEFNVVACVNCHEKPVTGGSAARYRDFLLVRRILPDQTSQNTGINGVQPQFTLAPTTRRPTDAVTNLQATRSPIPFFGVGLLAELADEEILSRADAEDLDGDGISGRPNYDRGFVGRFGRKSQTVSIEGFIRGPVFNHMGITTDPLSNERKTQLPVPSSAAPASTSNAESFVNMIAFLTRPLVSIAHAQVAADDNPNFDFDGVPDPEMPEQDLFDLVSFSMLLAAPMPDPPTEQSLAGSALFDGIGCADCHVPALNGPRGPVPVYSDLLLHDMGPELADGIKMGQSMGAEYRTQPLWGITAFGPYLHDGRADTLDQAIRLHGGEGEAARDGYEQLSESEQADVLAFLESLGGASQRSDGMVPPGTPMQEVGSLGGPATALTASEQELFLRGRDVFDRDTLRSQGLGPLFNGDSCRACHFDPIVGGSGGIDLNVIRHGLFADGAFLAPLQGTIAHRQSTELVRPPIDLDANVFEGRQPPPCFGLGFLESIADEAILANEDCNNPDPTAISGCARFLDSGKLGRLGWKMDVPDLSEFSRDAMSNEVGITLPEVPGHTFGKLTDDDDIPDPEISEDDLIALTFFMKQLAPPPGHSVDPIAEAAGEIVFDAVGCGGCHVSDFVTPTGVVAYTDLLLHDVAPAGKPGIADGTAGTAEFRTPPLWGLSVTAPYMHDGRAFSVDSAIRKHDGEAAASRDTYEGLSQQQQADLLAFLASL